MERGQNTLPGDCLEQQLLGFASSAPALAQGDAAGVLTSGFNKRGHPWAGSLQNAG